MAAPFTAHFPNSKTLHQVYMARLMQMFYHKDVRSSTRAVQQMSTYYFGDNGFDIVNTLTDFFVVDNILVVV